MACYEGGAAGGAALLPVPVGEHRAFMREAVNVRCTISHESMVVGADVEPANIVSPDNQNVRFLIRHNISIEPSSLSHKRSLVHIAHTSWFLQKKNTL